VFLGDTAEYSYHFFTISLPKPGSRSVKGLRRPSRQMLISSEEKALGFHDPFDGLVAGVGAVGAGEPNVVAGPKVTIADDGHHDQHNLRRSRTTLPPRRSIAPTEGSGITCNWKPRRPIRCAPPPGGVSVRTSKRFEKPNSPPPSRACS
jgi:hypothetical protein